MKNIDVYGEALSDYYTENIKEPLFLYTNGSKDQTSVDIFFRKPNKFPTIEQIAIALCKGKILDIGAGVGSHTLQLQELGYDVTALEISKTACHIMKERGVKNSINTNIFEYEEQQFDTLLFVMNGIGLVQDIEGLEQLLEHMKKLLKPGGQILFDSSDIEYYYHFGNKKPAHYYGEVDFQYEYKGQKGNPFKWLYIDQAKMKEMANKAGWSFQVLDEDDHHHYLARMELMPNS